METKNNLGCGRKSNINSSLGFICGVTNAWGQDKLCSRCDGKMRFTWSKPNKTLKELTVFVSAKGGYIKGRGDGTISWEENDD